MALNDNDLLFINDSTDSNKGKGVKLPNGDWVGYRPRSKSGSPTVDVSINGNPFNKIHFP